MNYTSAEANKLLKKLNDEYTALLDKETRSRDFRAAMGEDVASVRPAYDCVETQARLAALEEKIRRLKHAINCFNTTHFVDGFDMNEKKQRAAGRKLVGMVFQYPDYQLFDSTVYDDICFGLKNLKLPEEEIRTRAYEAMELVGLDTKQDAEKSPFELSGGKKRRAALAGIIAMRPKYLVMDEPMAGLDPSGRREVMKTIEGLRAELGCSVIMVSHSMEDVARSAERIAVLNNGKVYAVGTPTEIFSRTAELASIGLDTPATAQLVEKLRGMGCKIPDGLYTNEKFEKWLKEVLHNA